MKSVVLVCALALSAGGFVATVAAPSTPAPPKVAPRRPLPATSSGDAAPDVRPPKKATAPEQPGEPAAPSQPGKRPATDKTAPAEPSKTEIFSKECELDNPSHIGIFTGDVVVVNPQFKMNCDKLFAYIRHDEPKDSPDKVSDKTPASQPPAGNPVKPGAPGATPAPGGSTSDRKPARAVEGSQKAAASPQPKAATPATAKSEGEKGEGGASAKLSPGKAAAAATDAAKDAVADKKSGGLQKAIAEGNVVITQDKTDANGNVEHDVAHAKKALYDTDTGDVTLYGKPDVQQGGNHVIALDETTIIILNRSGHMTVHGPHKVVLENSGSTAPDSKNTNAR